MESSSTSKGPIVAKVLIDLSEYKALKEAKKFQELHESELSKKYRHDVQSESGEEDVEELPQHHHSLEQSTAQVGLGAVSDLKDLIVSTIGKCLQEALVQQFQQYFIPQFGGTAGLNPTAPISDLNDLAQPLPPTEPQNNAQRVSGGENYVKSDQNDEADELLLLKKIPKRFQIRARKLLEAFDKHPTIISWNSEGVLFLDGNSIPQSNMYKLLPEVFKLHPDYSLPGFKEFVKKLASLGLGLLINRSILRGLTRREKIENESDIYDYITKNTKNWYYIGR